MKWMTFFSDGAGQIRIVPSVAEIKARHQGNQADPKEQMPVKKETALCSETQAQTTIKSRVEGLYRTEAGKMARWGSKTVLQRAITGYTKKFGERSEKIRDEAFLKAQKTLTRYGKKKQISYITKLE